METSQSSRRQDAIRTATSNDFGTRVLDGAGPIIVEFMSYGCAHCRELEPVLQQVAVQLRTTATIYRVNIALAADLAENYQVEGTPTLVMFLDGQEVGRVTGPDPSFSSLLAILTEPFQR